MRKYTIDDVKAVFRNADEVISECVANGGSKEEIGLYITQLGDNFKKLR